MQGPEQQLNLYRFLVEKSLGLMCIHDSDGVLLSVNAAVTYSLGYEADEGVGRNLRDFLLPSVQHLFRDYLKRISDHGSDSGIMRLVAKDGTERTWFYRNTSYQEQGGPPLVLGHAVDITNRVRTENALKKAKRELRQARDELAARVTERTAELEEANERLRAEIERRVQAEEELLRARKLESLGVLAGGIAHDFNNFLTIVQGNVGLARMQLGQDDSVSNILEQTTEACRRASSLASQLLTFAKGGAPVRRVVSVARLVRDAVDLAGAGANVTIDVSIADDLWLAEIDVEQISQVLHNILLNARQASTEGGILEIGAENFVAAAGTLPLKAGSYVKISIRDFGHGIPPEVLPKVFDPYFTTKQSGTGLGLATAHAIVAKHGGHITAQSRMGVDTIFSVYLPASEHSLRPEPAAPEVLHRGSGRILVMDDEAALCTLLTRILEQLGYEVMTARDGAEAIAIFKEEKAMGRGFSAALFDVTIPGGMGGVEAAAKLKEINPLVKVIVSSGYSDAAVMSDFRRYGFDAVIPKPWTLAQISEVFRSVLRAGSKKATRA